MKRKSKHELKIKLTQEQRSQIVELMSKTGSAKIETEILFDVNVKKNVIAPSTVMVGMAT